MRYQLTPAYEEQVVQFIRAGGYDWVASEAAGVPRAVFETWLKRGGRRQTQPYRQFFERVLQARAQARLKAEIDARDQDPRFWLKHGPAKELPRYPGWSNPARPNARAGAGDDNVFDSPEVRRFLSDMVRVLMPFPEARSALLPLIARKRRDIA